MPDTVNDSPFAGLAGKGDGITEIRRRDGGLMRSAYVAV